MLIIIIVLKPTQASKMAVVLGMSITVITNSIHVLKYRAPIFCVSILTLLFMGSSIHTGYSSQLGVIYFNFFFELHTGFGL